MEYKNALAFKSRECIFAYDHTMEERCGHQQIKNKG
jgi:hypothetical protein